MSSVWSKNINMKVYPYVSRLAMNNVWKFPTERHVAQYSEYMMRSKNHLEIGTASVHCLTKANIFDRLNMNVTLLDIEEAPLNNAKEELIANGFHKTLINTIQCDVTQINENTISDMNNKIFDTIAMGHVLHCIPGSINEKFPKILDGLSSYMDKNTKFFGCSHANIEPDGFNAFPEKFMNFLRQQKILFNENDTTKDMEKVLSEYFGIYDVTEVGYVTMFEAYCKKINASMKLDVEPEMKFN
eukprot:334831_1